MSAWLSSSGTAAADRPHLHLAGIPVRLELTFFLVIGLLGFLVAPTPALLGAWVAIATVSVLVHELGHALAYRAYGHGSSITLHGFGGVTVGPVLPPGPSLVVSLAGPLSGLVLVGLPALLAARAEVVTTPDARLVLFYVLWINLVWSALNLLPVMPLDGGNIVSSLVSLVTGRDGERVARVLSVAVAAVLIVVALTYGYLFGALLAGFFLATNASGLRRDRSGEWRAALGEAQRALLEGDGERASALAGDVLAARPMPALERAARELAAWGRLVAGDRAGAEAILARPGVDAGATLRGAVALAAGRAEEGLALLTWGFAHEEDLGGQLFATMLVAHTGHCEALARELLALEGDRGLEPAWRLQATLATVGREDEARSVARCLVADGRRPHSP